MNKKYYLPDNIAIVILCIFLLVLGLLPFFGAIRIFIVIFQHIDKSSLEDTMIRVAIGIIMILPIILLGYKISQYMCYTIILDKDKIYIHEDTNSKNRKIQYYTYVNYSDINSIDILWTNRKSNGEKSSEHSITGGGTKIPYLRIETKKGEQKLFMIMFTTKKTIKRLILELNQRLVNNGNEIHLDDVDSIIKSLKK